MKKSLFIRNTGWVILFNLIIISISAQSPDSRICNCFTRPVEDNFLLASKAFYGNIGIALQRDMVLSPNQMQAVRFTLPTLESKAGCRTSYSIYISDETGNKVYEASGSNPSITYTFRDCEKNYSVTLMAFSRSGNGSEGNCSRRLTFKVKPKCNAVVCDCYSNSRGHKRISADFNLSGRVECRGFSGTDLVSYVIKFDVQNKTKCILNLQKLSLHGQSVEVPEFNVSPQGQVQGISLGFTTPILQSRPTGSKILVSARYVLNGKKCDIQFDLPYTDCFLPR